MVSGLLSTICVAVAAWTHVLADWIRNNWMLSVMDKMKSVRVPLRPYVHASVRPLRPCVLCVLASNIHGRHRVCPLVTDESRSVRPWTKWNWSGPKKGTWHATCAWNYKFLTGVWNYNHLTGLCNKSLSQTKPNRRYGGALRPASCVHASYDDTIPPPVLFQM